jgi:AcrR family transcriptional regulator
MSDETTTTKRRYEKKARAAQEEATRQRVIDAAIELHGTVGPGPTTLSAVAERAGVQRNTLYRHFADERTLLFACSSHWGAQHPVPAPDGWDEIADPVARTRHGLRVVYAYFEETEAMMTLVLRDAELHDDVAEALDAWMEGFDPVRDALLRAWPRSARRKQAAALVDVALSFRTWQTLVRARGLRTRAAADLMADTLGAVLDTKG